MSCSGPTHFILIRKKDCFVKQEAKHFYQTVIIFIISGATETIIFTIVYTSKTQIHAK